MTSDVKTAETQLMGLQTNQEKTRNTLRDTVKQFLDNRYAQFDGIFVRLMECQVRAVAVL